MLGLTYDPTRDELFLAERGRGAWLNGESMHVSEKQRVQDCLVGFDMGYDNDRARLLLEFLASLWPGVQSLRNMGSAALGIAYVAAGRTDLYLHRLLSPWDHAPGVLLVQEAGGGGGSQSGMAVPSRCAPQGWWPPMPRCIRTCCAWPATTPGAGQDYCRRRRSYVLSAEPASA